MTSYAHLILLLLFLFSANCLIVLSCFSVFHCALLVFFHYSRMFSQMHTNFAHCQLPKPQKPPAKNPSRIEILLLHKHSHHCLPNLPATKFSSEKLSPSPCLHPILCGHLSRLSVLQADSLVVTAINYSIDHNVGRNARQSRLRGR